jgi:2-keto-4-pentenoate hydratase/2-oxohepta-3-ene-1,7-dioic acid hydratase in catechol pathway
MRILTFAYPDEPDPHLGALLGEVVIDFAIARRWALEARNLPLRSLPASLFEFIYAGPPALRYARNLLNALEGENPLELSLPNQVTVGRRIHEVSLYPPLPRPMSVRDFYAFEQHVANARATRNSSVPTEWYQFPVFYFSNTNAIFGPGETIPYPSYTQALDYELEVACVIGKTGINIPAEQAGEYIFGYTIFNDWSARDIQRRETRVGLGPAKAKDFASSLGPWLVTPDELADCATDRPGVYDLQMKARVNGELRSQGNWKEVYYSFGEMIERASQDVYLLPGEVIGSGTVGNGCLLELTQGNGPWLQSGDQVELEIERLGKLANRVGRKGYSVVSGLGTETPR